MSERRRFYEALSWLVYTEDWDGLEYIEHVFDHERGEILAEWVTACRRCIKCKRTCSQEEREFDLAFAPELSRVIE